MDLSENGKPVVLPFIEKFARSNTECLSKNPKLIALLFGQKGTFLKQLILAKSISYSLALIIIIILL